MHNDMVKLNQLIHKNRGKQDTLQQDNILMENDFIATLKVGDQNIMFVFVCICIGPLEVKQSRPRKHVEHRLGWNVILLFIRKIVGWK